MINVDPGSWSGVTALIRKSVDRPKGRPKVDQLYISRIEYEGAFRSGSEAVAQSRTRLEFDPILLKLQAQAAREGVHIAEVERHPGGLQTEVNVICQRTFIAQLILF